MKRSTVGWIVAGSIGAALLFLAAVVAAGYYLVKGTTPKPAADADKKLVVDTARLAEVGADVDPNCGKTTVTRMFGQPVNVEYECDTDRLYVLAGAQIHRTSFEAQQSFVLATTATRLGVAVGSDAQLQQRNDLLNFGDQRYAAVIRSGDTDSGNIFVFRNGRIVHSLMIGGLYFDDPDAVRNLFQPVLDAAQKQYP